MTAKSSTCKSCRAPVLIVREVNCKLPIGPMKIDPAPISALIPLERAPPPLWENHPRLGWRCLDLLRRHGYPIHAAHRCS
ncbi:hypothetical protein [Nonomuraea sediminis]|uniref:hypothetical protein n=1 Tax=Nonomuraea sediminis TaxID=2835864 RepID=UPI001BDD99A7|nr:hypothetical protein [Nonomuraea sediminis]